MIKEVDFKKHLHYDFDMEAAVLGACLLEDDAFPRVRAFVEPSHFYYKQNELIFSMMSDMWKDGKGLDMVSVVHEIYRKKIDSQFDGNPSYYLTTLTRDVVSSSRIEQHALYLRQMFGSRELIKIQMDAGKSDAAADPLKKMMEIQDRLKEVMSIKGEDDWMDMSQVMIKLSKHVDSVAGKDMIGVPTGLPSIDRITSGLQETQLVVVGARPSVGKTAFLASVASNMAAAGHPVGINVLEMPGEQFGARILSFHSKIQFWRIWRAKFDSNYSGDRMYQSMGDVANLPIYISDKTNVSVSDIRAKAIKLKKRTGMKVLFIDYLQLMEADGKSGNREQEVARMCRGLKLMAMELKICVVLFVQLNRESDKSPDKKPRMSQARESGAIEQDADIFMLLHRDWKAGILEDEHGASTERKATVIIEKHRNGETGPIDVEFDPETMAWYEESAAYFRHS